MKRIQIVTIIAIVLATIYNIYEYFVSNKYYVFLIVMNVVLVLIFVNAKYKLK